MHVPVLILLDTYFSQNDPQYEANKDKKRKLLILISFSLSLFWGGVPLLGWTPMTFEPSGLSCAVYQATPDMAYISYIMCCFVFFELIPLAIVGFCKSQNKEETQSLKVNLISLLINKKIELFNGKFCFLLFKPYLAVLTLIVAWTPLTIVYMWPIFGDHDNIPMRIVAWSSPFAKLSAFLVPVFFLDLNEYETKGKK